MTCTDFSLAAPKLCYKKAAQATINLACILWEFVFFWRILDGFYGFITL